jgi:hypothetical protein
MWIRDVEFPAALLDAHRAGELVIFVGAGASRDSPSDLPDFRALTKAIAENARVDVTDEELDLPDFVLGRLADRDEVDVHRRVVDLIGPASSKPNRLHHEIAALATAGLAVRVVTTNYDLHLSTALRAGTFAGAEYAGPALPMGDDFTGLVSLHGSLAQEPRHLVVTDRDFGRAYLKDAWATRFLERMFAKYTVLFIGYSHRDVVMRYLGRALIRDGNRYAMTSSDDSYWRQLGIHPVTYPAKGGSHAALPEAIHRWAELAAWGMLEHRQHVAGLVTAPPSKVPEEESYLEALVADPNRVALFTDLARGEDWLLWAAAQPEFRRLFDPTAPATRCSVDLAYWFAEHFVMDEGLTNASLRVVRGAGGRLGPTVWSAIGHHLHMGTSPRAAWLGPWLVLLVENDPGAGERWLEYALVASRWPQDAPAALLLFDRLIEPRAVLDPWPDLGGAPQVRIRTRGDEDFVRQAWQTVFAANLAYAAPALLAISDRHLRRAHALLVTANSAGSCWDPVSYGRRAIRQHPQNGTPEGLDLLIDAARDALDALLASPGRAGVSYLDAWVLSEVPVLRRLALHGWALREDLDATAKLEWLRQRGWLFEDLLRPEVFHLLEVALPEASQDAADGLVADVTAWPGGTDEHGEYWRFSALSWILRHRPNLDSARAALDQVQEAHPKFQERPHPGLLSWSGLGRIRPSLPMSPTQLHDRIVADVAQALEELLVYKGREVPFDAPAWSDATELLTQTVKEHPTDGLRVLDAPGAGDPDLVRAVIQGWASATPDDNLAVAVLDRLVQVDLATFADEVAMLLAAGSAGRDQAAAWHRFTEAQALALALWSARGGDALPTDVADWLHAAVNHWAGRLAEFWLQVVATKWRVAGDSWEGLPPGLRIELDGLLSSGDDRAAMVEVVFASQVHFFFAADRSWCEARILPLLDWEDASRARRTWDGYLAWGRWNDPLLEAGLISNYLAAVDHFREFREELRPQLWQHLASVAVSSEREVLAWVQDFTARVGIPERADWMHQVTWMLDQLPPQEIEHQWVRWMEPYWQARLASRVLAREEASALAAWAVRLTDSVEAGVSLALSHEAGLGAHARLLHDLSDERLERAPESFARLVTHLLHSTQPPFWGCSDLDRIARQLRNGRPPLDVSGIAEEAMRLGCAEAARW